jgi:MFS transporter, FSR family, fosmidomycin resistance protein
VSLKLWRARPARAGTAVLAAALAVELADELVDGTKSAALPLIRQSLHLSYVQVGLLASVPLLLGSLLELPVGVLAGTGRRRRLAVLAGGVVFILSLAAVAAARSFGPLLAALVIFFPASGAFVGLTESGLMDFDPGRQEQHMARWNLAGSAGSLAGPVLLIAVLAAGGGWRSAYLVLAGVAAAAWLAAARNPPPPQAGTGRADPPGAAAARQPRATTATQLDAAPATQGDAAPATQPRAAAATQLDAAPATQPRAAAAARDALRALGRPGVARCLLLLQVSDLLLDVLTGFVALYLVDVGRATPAEAALGVAVRLGAGLAGNAALVWALERIGGLTLLRASAAAAALLYPGFLLVPGIGPKFALLGCLSAATAPWYPVLQAELYGCLPKQSGVAVSLSSAASLLGGAGPLAVGFVAQRLGLAWALAGLAAVAPGLLAGLWRWPRRAGAPTPP